MIFSRTYCQNCNCDPCQTPGFCEACRKSDTALGRGQPFFGDDLGPMPGSNGPEPPPHTGLNGQNGGAAQPTVPPIVENFATLRTEVFQPIKWAVPNLIPEGCSLFVGRPKSGKSWWLLDVCFSITVLERYCLGNIQCEQGDALYLALEDNKRRLQGRGDKLLTYGGEWPQRLSYATKWPRANAGGLEAIRAWIAAANNPRLIVIDTLALFRAPRRKDQQPYECDYETIHALQQIASETGVAVVIIHHLRKSQGEGDPFEKVSGTLGLSGAADTVYVLDRDGQCTTLYGRGRDIEEIELAVEFNKATCRWTILGPAAEIRRSSQRGTVLEALNSSAEPMSPKDVADHTGMPHRNIKKMLVRMFEAGEVTKAGRGCYRPTLVVDNTKPVVERQPRPFAVGDMVWPLNDKGDIEHPNPVKITGFDSHRGIGYALLEGFLSGWKTANLRHAEP